MTIWQFAVFGLVIGFLVGSCRAVWEASWEAPWCRQEKWAARLGYSVVFGALAALLGVLWHLPGVF